MRCSPHRRTVAIWPMDGLERAERGWRSTPIYIRNEAAGRRFGQRPNGEGADAWFKTCQPRPPPSIMKDALAPPPKRARTWRTRGLGAVAMTEGLRKRGMDVLGDMR